jgi:hypothetical protein
MEGDYHYIINNKQLFQAFFKLINYQLEIDNVKGVIYLSGNDSARYNFTKLETILLYILMQLYIEKTNTLSCNESVIVKIENINNKYQLLYNEKIKPNRLKSAFSTFKNFNLIEKVDADVYNDNSELKLLPSILVLIQSNSVSELYDKIQKKLEDFKTNENEGETIDEEIN